MARKRRAGEPRCEPEAGRFVPTVDRSKCEAKAACVEVCPYDVFEVRALTPAERDGLGLFARVKLFVHGGRQAFAVRAADCRACNLCVTVCPEDAIRLVPAG